ncbi:MAG: hypothetical protein ACJ8H8_24555 [Geminicoccaceae bacterium]
MHGKGLQDGFVVGPELRFDTAPCRGLQAACDGQLHNAGWDKGILQAVLDLGLRF